VPIIPSNLVIPSQAMSRLLFEAQPKTARGTGSGSVLRLNSLGLLGRFAGSDTWHIMAKTCIVVKRGEYDRYDLLHRAFGDRLPVVWDRRRVTRLRLDDALRWPRVAERRSSRSADWEDLGFVVTSSGEP
jgi:hypothetical protein